MVVQVLHTRRKSRLRQNAKFSVLGDGLLERTRSTTFALLGVTAAVGLAVIAVALQEDWPLVAGSPVPRAPVLHESVGEATALGAKPSPGVAPGGPAPRTRSGASRGRSAPVPGAAPVTSTQATPNEVVSSPATQVKPQGGNGHGGGSHGVAAVPQAQAPSAPQPSQTSSTVAPTSQPSAPPVEAPSPAQAPPVPSPPEPVASEGPPVEPIVPPASHGEG